MYVQNLELHCESVKFKVVNGCILNKQNLPVGRLEIRVKLLFGLAIFTGEFPILKNTTVKVRVGIRLK